MPESKKFFWLKLHENFFEQDSIEFLMSQENGANYVVLYQLLCLKFMNSDGKMQKQVGQVIINYDVPKIKNLVKYFDENTIIVALQLFIQLGLVYQEEENGVLQIANFENMIGSESKWAKYKRSSRELENVQKLSNECPTEKLENVQQENRDIEYRDIEYKSIENREKKVKEKRAKYGTYSHVLLSDNELTNLELEFGIDETQEAIQYLDDYIEMTGKSYKNHNLALRKWVFKAVQEKKSKPVQESQNDKLVKEWLES